MPSEAKPDYMTVQQAAKYLSVPPGAIRQLLDQHGLGALLRAPMNKQVLIRRQDLDAMQLTQGILEPREEIAAAPKPARRRRKGAA